MCHRVSNSGVVLSCLICCLNDVSQVTGSHATLVIDDAATRRWVGFDTEDKPQSVFNDQMVLDMFAMKQSDYEEAVHENILTRAEKYAFIESIKKLKLNDYAKMVFASNYTGYKL